MFPVIYADPAWTFRTYSERGKDRSPEQHYPTMSLAEMKALPVAQLAAPDCALLMWSTWPHLPQALELGEAWGFEYKTAAFTWAKVNKRRANRASLLELEDDSNWFMGLGYWTRANSEPCLLFTRGRPQRKARDVRQLVVSAIRKHSQKPDCVYSRIEALVDGPYLELFARQRRPGWSSWGNEIVSDIVMEVFDE